MSTSEQDMIALMRKLGKPITRENYIDLVYGDDRPDPWTALDEDTLPEELQDWSLFEQQGNELVAKSV